MNGQKDKKTEGVKYTINEPKSEIIVEEPDR